MPSYLLVAAIVASVSVWYGFNFHPFTLNSTLKFQRLFPTTKDPPKFTFYKLSLQWPPSSCNSGQMKCKPATAGPTPSVFTIHGGVWPQDQFDEPIPRYDRNNPCTNVAPTSSAKLPTELEQIQKDLESLWPDLKDPSNWTSNLEFWTKEWNRHGKCSDYPRNPRTYFNLALRLRKGLDPVMGLKRGSTDTLRNFESKIRKVAKANSKGSKS